MLGGALAETSLTNLRNGCEFLANTVRDFLPAARICPEETVQFLQSQLGADKTTVSVMTGHQQYHPVYMSLGNIHNEMRRAHRDAVIPLAFLAISKRTYRF